MLYEVITNAFLVKPFTESQLLNAVSEALGLNRGAPSASSGEEKEKGKISEGDLTELIRMSGDDLGFVEEMIEQFEKSTCEGLQEMLAALEEHRFGTIRELAHT